MPPLKVENAPWRFSLFEAGRQNDSLGDEVMAVAGPDLRRMGVVGAGGAGFPTAVKAGSRVEFVLANGAECEPLVHKDVHVMEKFAPQVVGGMRFMMALTGAGRGYFGVKTKNRHAMDAVASRLRDRDRDDADGRLLSRRRRV